jgi:hypothetical protein
MPPPRRARPRRPRPVGLLAWAILAYKNPEAPPDLKLIGRSSASASGEDKPQP